MRVQVVYDEPLPLDNYEGVDITRLTQELRPKSPYELNVMHITVDGKPIDDPGRSSSDIQRCTDVALDNAKIQFRFDNLESRPRLAVAAYPVAVAVSDLDGRPAASVVRFRDVQQLCELHRACRNPNLRAAAVIAGRAARNHRGRRRGPRGMAAGAKNSRGAGTRTQVSAARLRLEG